MLLRYKDGRVNEKRKVEDLLCRADMNLWSVWE